MTKKIDGRKAVVTTTGALFRGYSEFANYYDYPESAGQYPETNPNRSLKNGDVVTLIVSGKHLNLLYSYPLWIIEAENGEKYIIGERGLNILEKGTEDDASMEIEGVKYREVKRKAKVGERILVTNDSTKPFAYKGASGVVVRLSDKDVQAEFDYGNYRNHPDNRWYVKHLDYVVLEPIAVDAAAITELTRKVNELSAELSEIKRQLAELSEKTTEAVAAPEAYPQSTRDWAVEKAKAEVAELIRIGTDRHARLPNESRFSDEFYAVQFEVNRDKRTVVALIKGLHNTRVVGRGIAKCARGDCFNVHIGKAIALYRALGLRVPDEFVYAPQPEGFRRGDVLEWADGSRYGLVNVNHPEYTFYSYAWGKSLDPLRYPDGPNASVIDDSDRYESEGSA